MRTLSLTIEGRLRDRLDVVSFSGTEAVNRLFGLLIDFTTDATDDFLEDAAPALGDALDSRRHRRGAKDGITLRCGDRSLELSKDGGKSKGSAVSLSGSRRSPPETIGT